MTLRARVIKAPLYVLAVLAVLAVLTSVVAAWCADACEGAYDAILSAAVRYDKWPRGRSP